MARGQGVVATSGPPSVCANTDCRALFRTSAVVGASSITRGGPLQRLCPRCAKKAKADKASRKEQRKNSTKPGPSPDES